jgi:hypothetical protein
MKKIIVTFNAKTGGITITTEGYQGATCLAATRELEEGLGIREPERTMTDEFHQQVEGNQEVGL